MLNLDTIMRIPAALIVVSLFLFLIDNTLIYWFGFPGISSSLVHQGMLSEYASYKPLASDQEGIALFHIVFNSGVVIATCFLVCISGKRSITNDAELYSRISGFIVRAAFWSVFLIGIADMLVSFLRIEGMLSYIVGENMTTQLGRSIFRGTYLHFPLILFSIVLSFFTRTLGFIWLALLIVAAEFLIVLTRFVFSYEQAFMGDLVRFWYAGLFLFASAYTLLNDGHVRVDVFYANFSEKGKALTNSIGSLILGLPLCWIILIFGMSGKGSIINSPLLSFEISQSGFGMYTKYLMASYLIVFAVSMAIQFTGFILSNFARFRECQEGSTEQVAETL